MGEGLESKYEDSEYQAERMKEIKWGGDLQSQKQYQSQQK